AHAPRRPPHPQARPPGAADPRLPAGVGRGRRSAEGDARGGSPPAGSQCGGGPVGASRRLRGSVAGSAPRRARGLSRPLRRSRAAGRLSGGAGVLPGAAGRRLISPMLPLLLTLLIGASPPPDGAALRLASQAFGRPVEIEVRGLPQETAREVIRKALAEIADLERLTDAYRPDGGLAALNAAAGKGPQAEDPRLIAILARAGEFCFWSEGAHGPLGRDLYSLWGLRTPVPDPPSPERLAQAVSVTACDRLV